MPTEKTAAARGDGSPPRAVHQNIVFDEGDLREFATGSISKVLGPQFVPLEGIRHVRLPAPPYLLASRVTEMNANLGDFSRSTITSEFDVKEDAWFLLDGMVPAAIAIESGQCDLLLVAALGIDLESPGERVYRLLDSTLCFHGPLPRGGQTLRHEITIERFVQAGQTRIFYFSYRAYADGQFFLELTNACAGFFTDAELGASRGIVQGRLISPKTGSKPRPFKPILNTNINSLTRDQVLLLTSGRVSDVFGPNYDQRGMNPSLRLPSTGLLMIDEVPSIDRRGGSRGLGALTAKKYLDSNSWYFSSHFVDDHVLPGSLVAEGGVQLLQVFAFQLGLPHLLPDAEFQTVPGLETSVQVRGQIDPTVTCLRYEANITDITLLPRPTITADIMVYNGNVPIVDMRNFGVQIRERSGSPYRVGPGGERVELGRRSSMNEPVLINEMHLAHAAKGDLGTAMGPEFDFYANSRAPYIPNGDFQFVDRVVTVKGERGALKPGAEMVTEYDSMRDEWYYAEHLSPVMPNAIALETSLQSAVLLGYYLGATLGRPDLEFGIRNLDGKATWLATPDLRGKTIRQVTRMESSTAFGDTVLQSFSYELSVDGIAFYRGSSMFGYFTAAGLSDQKGLDAGQRRPLWIDGNTQAVRTIVKRGAGIMATGPQDGRRLPAGRLELIDELTIISGGGEYGEGYVLASAVVLPDDWYFSCHFYRDPVMPGSLGIEALIQCMQAYVLQRDLTPSGATLRFEPLTGQEMAWSYRGQVSQDDKEVIFELHVVSVQQEERETVIVADGYLFKDGLRIYEARALSLRCTGFTDGESA